MNSRPSLFLFPLISIFILSLVAGKQPEIYSDAKWYYELGASFYRDGFSLLNYQGELRGYLFPLSLYVLQSLAKSLGLDDMVFFRMCFGLAIAAFTTILVPAYFEALTRMRVAFVPRLLFALLVIYYWWGYILYPLTDFPALILLVGGMYTLFLALGRFAGAWRLRSFLLWIAAFAIGASVIVRPAYQIVLLPVLVYLLLRTFKILPRAWPRLGAIGLFGLGLFISWLPQMAINYHKLGTPTPFPRSELWGNNLYESQLTWGIVTQRYETNIGPEPDGPRVRFLDRLGINVKDDAGIDENLEALTLRQYMRLVLRYPMDFVTIYFRHLFNGLDTTYSTPYVMQIDNNRILFSLLNYTLQFICLAMTLVWLPVWIREREIVAHLIVLVLPVLVALPGAVEVRFFLPVYFIMYACVSYIFAPHFRIAWLRRYAHVIVPLYALYVSACFTLSASAFLSIKDLVYTLSR